MLLLPVTKMVIFLGGLSSLVYSFDLTHLRAYDTDSSQISCIMAFLLKYFQSVKPLSGAVITMSFNSESSKIQQDILRAMHAQQYLTWTVVVRYPKPIAAGSASSTILHEKPQCYLVVVENLEDGVLDEVYEDWKSTINWNPIAQFVVYLTVVEESDQNMNDLMIAIMLIFMKKKVYNINVIGRYKGVKYFCGKTVFPYHPLNNCGNRVIRIDTLDICYYDDMGDAEWGENKYGDEDSGDDGSINGKGNGDGNVEISAKGDGKLEENGNGDFRVLESEDWKGYGYGDKDGYKAKEKGGNGVENVDQKGHSGEDEDMNVDGGCEDKGRYRNNTAVDEDRNYNLEEDGENENGNVNGDKEGVVAINSYKGVAGNYNLEEDGENENGNVNGDKERGVAINSYKGVAGDVGIDADRNMEGNENCVDDEKDIHEITNKVMIENVYGEAYTEGIKEEVGVYQAAKNAYRSAYELCKQARMKHEPQQSTNLNNTTTPKIKLQELNSGLFSDKVPKDLSGCPIIAGYRPWEPYIFKELNTDNFVPITGKPKDQKSYTTSKVKSAEESNQNYVYEYAYAASDEDDNYADRDSEPSANNDVDAAHTNAEPAKNPTYKLKGIEYELIQTIAEVLNIKIDFQVVNDNLYLLFQQLIDGKVELIFGGIDEDPGISQYVSSLIPYHQDDLTWCVAKAQRNYSLFNIFQSFHKNTWILTMVLILVVTINVCLSQKLLNLRLLQYRGIFATFAQIYGIVLSQSAAIGHLPNSLRFTFICTFFFSLMFVNFYQSVLVSTLTTPKSSYQISHLEEIYRNRMAVTGSVDNVRHLNKDGEIFKYIRKNFEMCHNLEQCLNHAAHDKHIAVAVSRQHSFYNPRIQRDHLYCFDRNENIYMYLVTMLLPKKYHLLHKINPVIHHVLESGHMEKWARDLDMKRKIREKIRQAQMESVKQLTINQVVGCFAVHAMILALALVVFLVELWTHWMVVKRRTRLRLVKVLHRKFYEM